MNETDWNTPRNGDFVRYVEQLTADSLQRVQSRAHAPGTGPGPHPAGMQAASAEVTRAANSPGAVEKPEAARQNAAAGWVIAGLVVLGMLSAAGAPAGLLVLLAAAGLWLFKRFARGNRAGSAARQMLGRLQQGLQNASYHIPAAGPAARRSPRKKPLP